MDFSHKEEPLSSFANEDQKYTPTCSRVTDAENLDAIKKYIEEQEKEILQMELEEKQNQEKKLLNIKIEVPNGKKEIINDISKKTEEITIKKDHLTNHEDNLSRDKKEANENVQVTSVLDMIISPTEIEKPEGTSKDISMQRSCKEEPASGKGEQKMMNPDRANSSTALSVGCKVEVKSFEGDWYAAEVTEVDYDEMEVLVRYEIDLKKTDEWVSVSSSRLRPYCGNTTKIVTKIEDIEESSQDSAATDLSKDAKEIVPAKEIKQQPQVEVVGKVEEKHKVVFEVGERCLARWRDNRRFCATVHKDLGDGNYEILFDDGFYWTCSTVRLHKMKGDSLLVDTSLQRTAESPMSPVVGGSSASIAPLSPVIPPAFHTHLFDPTRDYLGSKSERREKKRKLNIKEIFNIGQKKYKKHKPDDYNTTKPVAAPKPTSVKKPRILRKSAPKVPQVMVKKDVVKDVPDAVASIIGTLTKELEVKLEPLDVGTTRAVKRTENEEELITPADIDVKAETTNSVFEVDIDDIELEGCVVNPDDDTLDDEEADEPKSEGDPVLEEEVILENFEKQDVNKHEEVIDKIKEAIIKLEDGIAEIEKIKSPNVMRTDPLMCNFESPKIINSSKTKLEVKSEDLKKALEEAAASIRLEDLNTDVIDSAKIDFELDEKSVKESKPKRTPSRVKKDKKLRLLQKQNVNKQVEEVKTELKQMKKKFEEMRDHVMSPDFALQCQENAALPESFLFPREWCCRWVNGQPVGRVSEIEGSPQVGMDNKPGLPRRSVEVEDKRLPMGWTKHMVRRSVGNSAGKWDVVLVSPEQFGNKRFHMRTDMRNFLNSLPDGQLREYETALMDFGVHLKTSRRMGWVFNTPDGIAQAPETILPADTTCSISPLVKRKSTNHEKKKISKDKKRKTHKEKKRKPIKLKLQKGPETYNSLLIDDEPNYDFQAAATENVYEQTLEPLDDDSVYVGSLKVQILENLLRCPAEGCFKNFRTKTLLQMHIKHYHGELKEMMGATPKVLDLAYARQRVQPTEMDTPIDKKIIKVKINRPPKREEHVPKPLLSESESSIDITQTIKSEDSPLPKIPRSQDSPKLRQALIHKPVKRPKVLLPVRRVEPEQSISDTINDEVFETPITEPVVHVPMLHHPLDFETAISTHTVTKPADRKKKGDKKKSFASFSKNISEDEEWFGMNSDDLDTRSSFPRSSSPDSKMTDSKLPAMSLESNEDQKDVNLYSYNESGERIKIVHMKREEIINCHCGVREEDGLMVQCELCLCWQHALCHNIQRECEVPEKYTCSICLNPRRGRRSQRFLHDQDRLYEGLLPGAKPCDSLRRSHELAGNLLRIDDALHALRVKIYVATKKDHPKLYLWAKEWDQAEKSQTHEKLNSDYSDLNIMINGMDKENHPAPQDDGMDMATPLSEDQATDRSSQRDNQLGSQTLLSGLLSSPGGASLDLPISTSELERLAKSVQESAEWERVTAPQPEAAIENGACRERLLQHVQRCQALIDTRLESIEAQVAELESQDPSCEDSPKNYPRIKQTVLMLLRDLDTMEELGVTT